jgi:hypothetical protein
MGVLIRFHKGCDIDPVLADIGRDAAYPGKGGYDVDLGEARRGKARGDKHSQKYSFHCCSP